MGSGNEAITPPSHHVFTTVEQKVQQHIARSKKLKKFYQDAVRQQPRLQQAETELSEWEKALVEQELELQKCIDQMEELGEKFSGEAKDCRKRLEKSRE